MFWPHAHERALVLEDSSFQATAQDLLNLAYRLLAPLLLVRHLHQDIFLSHLPDNTTKLEISKQLFKLHVKDMW